MRDDTYWIMQCISMAESSGNAHAGTMAREQLDALLRGWDQCRGLLTTYIEANESLRAKLDRATHSRSDAP